MESETYLAVQSFFAASDQRPDSLWVYSGIFLLLILFLLSAVFSGSESAFFSLSPEEKTKLEKLQNKKSGRVLKLLSNLEKLMATLVTGNTLINLLIIFLSSFLLNQYDVFSLAKFSGIILQIAVIAVTLIIFGKVLPRIYAHNRALKFALFSAWMVVSAQKIFTPLNFLLVQSSSFINRRIIRKHSKLSIDELSDALDHTHGVVNEDRKILMGIVNFSNMEVSEVMKPRMDVTALDYDTDMSKLIQVINESGYSRIPVFTETFDNIRGILYVKDLLPHLGDVDSYTWQQLIRPGYFVPETKKIKDLLQEFLDKKIHMAIVVDEYGGTEGIVTLEDVLEEIVGDITDESDEIESFYSRIDDCNFIFDGKILLNDFFKIVEISEDLFDQIRGEADTLAGLILEIKGEIPPANETILLKNFSFTILSVDERRIKKVKFTMDKNLKTR